MRTNGSRSNNNNKSSSNDNNRSWNNNNRSNNDIYWRRNDDHGRQFASEAEKLTMLKNAWDLVYGDQAFPYDLIRRGLLVDYSMVAAAPSKQFPTLRPQSVTASSRPLPYSLAGTSLQVNALVDHATMPLPAFCHQVSNPKPVGALYANTKVSMGLSDNVEALTLAPFPPMTTGASRLTSPSQHDATSHVFENGNVTEKTRSSCPCSNESREGHGPHKCGRNILRDERLPNGHIVRNVPGDYHLVASGQHGKDKIAMEVYSAFKKLITRREADMTFFTTLMYGAVVAAFGGTMPVDQVETVMGVGRFLLLKEIEAHIEDPTAKDAFSRLYTLRNVLETSPKARTIDTKCIRELALMQAFVFSEKVANAPYPCGQTDGGPDGSNVQLICYWKPTDKTDTIRGTLQEFNAGLQRAGKKNTEVAEVVDHNLEHQLGLPRGTFRFYQITQVH